MLAKIKRIVVAVGTSDYSEMARTLAMAIARSAMIAR